ncbi:uncharacterized protein DUF2505 [Nocardioides albertanoniae]|uniref:Uncharacterized protein DUF2505 n=1 Tax=Nocardioides albertanoniae TaxID=1175486 RepID=A0A543AAQ7_9ACTN|nr:DUF2505 domain-containing protein [Nocardioides albertanoniae]TQL69688.1 uncharacterized protein DUF2505 [Nocardioides albertanoniae]
MKKLSIDLAYDAPIAAVSGMLADATFREQVCDAQHALSKSVAITGSTVSIRYEQEVSGVPGFAKKVVGDTIEVHQDEVWSTDFVSGDITVTLPGKPGSLSGTASLTESGGRTVETVSLEATVTMPLISGKLEDLILSIFKKALQKEHEVGVRWLAA